MTHEFGFIRRASSDQAIARWLDAELQRRRDASDSDDNGPDDDDDDGTAGALVPVG
jgi:hypothetical protein